MCAKLAERFEFLYRTRRISPGGSGLGRVHLAALTNKVSEGSGSASSAGKSSEVVQDLAPTHENALVRIHRQTSHGD
jgi:hypothetical protein